MEMTASEQEMQLLEIFLQEVVSPGTVPLDRCFAPGYELWMNGTRFDYNAFVQHVQQNREGTLGYSFNSYIIHETVTEGNKFVARYSLTGNYADGRPFTAMVLDLFEIKNGRFVHCWEFGNFGVE
jgi:hypothetical protein